MSTLAKTSPSSPQPGQMRKSSAWEAARRQVRAAADAQDVDAWLLAITKQLTISEYEVCRADSYDRDTGRPVSLTWVNYRDVQGTWCVPISELSTQRSFKGLYCPFIKLTLLPRLEKAGGQGVVFLLPAKAGQPAQGLSIRREYICTGGGHNDSPTYAYAVTFALVDVFTRLLPTE